MLIRFNRSSAVRAAYALYDRGEYSNVIKFCTAKLEEPGADPELRLLRGVAYLDRGKPNEAVADWETCCQDPHLAGVAHYYLGNFLSMKSAEHEAAAWDHYVRAVECGWVEGHIGKGNMLLERAMVCKEEERHDDAVKQLRDAVTELTAGIGSPAPASRRRALNIRGDVHFHLNDTAARLRDRAEENALPAFDPAQTDPRATGQELYS